MFKPIEKTDLHKVSLTGMRAIVILGLLSQSPLNMEEIREKLIGLNILEHNHSNDIIRIDLNTLRSIGCEITQATKKTEYKYVLIKSPFMIDFSKEEIETLKKVYKKIKNTSDISLLLHYHFLFNKLANYTCNDEVKEDIIGISVLKSYNCDLIQDLIKDCKCKLNLKLLYKTPGSNKETEKCILAQELVFQNDKIYLYGYDRDKSKSVILNVLRIKAIVEKFIGNNDVNVKKTTIKFLLKNLDLVNLEENESIIESSNSSYLIEASYYNDFVAMQRILSFGSNCTVLEPEEFKNKVIEKLKSMRNLYNGENIE